MIPAEQAGQGGQPIRLSAALIVRNEARFLPDCLRSLAGAADEIVVVDTGSTDETVQIASSFGARVFFRPWDGDFAAARNYGLDRCRGEWILYIDADERLSAFQPDDLDDALSDSGVIARSLWFSARVEHTPYLEMRLWRNDPRLRFVGCIHETIRPAVHAAAKADGLRLSPCALHLQHLGYEGDQVAKHHRNLPLLQRRVQETPDNVFNWCHLASVQAGLGNHVDAELALRRAVEAVRAAPTPRPQDSQAFAMLAQVLAKAEPDSLRLTEAQALVEEGLARTPDNLYLIWVRATLLVRQEYFSDAITVFSGLAALDPEAIRDPYQGYDKRIFRLFSYEGLGLCHFRLHQYAEAAHWYALAFQADLSRLDNDLRRRVADERRRKAE